MTLKLNSLSVAEKRQKFGVSPLPMDHRFFLCLLCGQLYCGQRSSRSLLDIFHLPNALEPQFDHGNDDLWRSSRHIAPL